MKEELTESLRELHLPTVRECYEEVARRAERETLSYERYLLELIDRECQDRRENRTLRLLRQSRLPLDKTPENFDFKRLPAEVSRHMRTLMEGDSLDRKENILTFGNSDPATFCTSLLHH